MLRESEIQAIIESLEYEQMEANGSNSIQAHADTGLLLLPVEQGGFNRFKSLFGVTYWGRATINVYKTTATAKSFFDYLKKYVKSKSKTEEHLINGETIIL